MKIQQLATSIINSSDQSLTTGQMELLRNSKSSIRHANATSSPYTQHISRCRNLKEPSFKVYPFYYKSDLMSSIFKEWFFIQGFKDILKAFHDFKNKQKVHEDKYTIHWDK